MLLMNYCDKLIQNVASREILTHNQNRTLITSVHLDIWKNLQFCLCVFYTVYHRYEYCITVFLVEDIYCPHKAPIWCID